MNELDAILKALNVRQIMNDIKIVQLLSCLSTTYPDSSWSVGLYAVKLEDCELRKKLLTYDVRFYYTENSNKFLLCIMSASREFSLEFVGTIEQVVQKFDNWSAVYRF